MANIGFISTWFDRGAAMVTKAYRDLISDEHNCFVYRRYEKWGYDGASPKWKKQYVTSDPSESGIHLPTFEKWVKDNNIDILFWNEQRSFEEVKYAKEKLGCINLAYVDYYTKDTIELFNIYDYIFCNTQRHYSVFKHMPQTIFMQWGTDIDLFKPKAKDDNMKDKLVFFHNAGWGGVDFRKGTNFVLRAFEKIKDKNARLIIHTQLPIQNYPEEIFDIVKRDERIIVYEGTIDAPGLYTKGDVMVYPSKLEGIGLSIAEALSSGLPVIVPDNQPMNEFINNKNGRKVKIAKTYQRESLPYYWDVCEVDIDDLVSQMNYYVANKKKIKTFKRDARNSAEIKFNWKNNSVKFKEIINDILLSKESKEVKKIRTKFLKKDKPIKIAHFSLFAPHQTGLYESARELIMCELNSGINAGMINTLNNSQYKEYLEYADRGIITRNLEWCKDADVLFLHSNIPPKIQDIGIPIIFVNHGSPVHCYLTEEYCENSRQFNVTADKDCNLLIDGVSKFELKGGESKEVKTGKHISYSLILNYLKNHNFKAHVTLWKQHMQFLEAMTDKHKVYHIPCPSDLNSFTPDGLKANFNKDEFNIVHCDMWRFSKDPFFLIHAFRHFLKDVPNARLYLYGYLPAEHGETWNNIIRTIDIRDRIAPLQSITNNIDQVYRAADLLVTTRSFETRIIRESMSCGTPIVTGGFSGNNYNCHYEDPESMYKAMLKAYKDIKKYGREKVGMRNRKYAEKNFSYKKVTPKLINVIHNVLQFHQPKKEIEYTVNARKPKIHLVGPYKANIWGAENRFISAIKEEGYPLTITDYRVENDWESQLLNTKADLMIVMKGEKLSDALLNKINCKKVLWYPDDVLELERARNDVKRQAKGYDIVYTFQKNSIDKYYELGCKQVEYLPFCVGTDIYKKIHCKKEYDIIFIGSLYENRKELIDYLRGNGLNIYIPNTFIHSENLVEMYNKTKIILNQCIGDSGLNNRVFEALGSGSLLLTNRPNDESSIFEDKKHLVYFDSKEHCLELANYYLKNKKERELIAWRGNQNVMKKHTYKTRLEKILNDLGL